MVREIVRDTSFLLLKSEDAVKEDLPIAQDLLDTLAANRERCVGMAANMIGERKRILVFDNNGTAEIMFNPVIVKKLGEYTAEEGCLSLDGTKSIKRWQTIKVEYLDLRFRPRAKTFTGWTAQIIQHEINHFDGILI